MSSEVIYIDVADPAEQWVDIEVDSDASGDVVTINSMATGCWVDLEPASRAAFILFALKFGDTFVRGGFNFYSLGPDLVERIVRSALRNQFTAKPEVSYFSPWAPAFELHPDLFDKYNIPREQAFLFRQNGLPRYQPVRAAVPARSAHAAATGNMIRRVPHACACRGAQSVLRRMRGALRAMTKIIDVVIKADDPRHLLRTADTFKYMDMLLVTVRAASREPVRTSTPLSVCHASRLARSTQERLRDYADAWHSQVRDAQYAAHVFTLADHTFAPYNSPEV